MRIKHIDLSEINRKKWVEELDDEIAILGVPFPHDLEIIKELVVFREKYKAIQNQCYHISKFVMKEIMTLLQTDGINSKKEVLGILQTYVDEGTSNEE